MIPHANLLFYTNLAGEVFYIIAHRMKSQAVKRDLQLRVYNDLAICICHPVVVQNLIKGSLQILEMTMADIRTLMDRIVHSSIMTVNSYSMDKLFELTLIATRYQYTVCQHPKDILLIALNHLDGIKNEIVDPTGIQLCENLHKLIVERLSGESSMMMQEYRFSILTYLADVKLKMTNLIKLGFQKSSGEFVKDFTCKTPARKEFIQPGTIELFGSNILERSDSSDTSDSNNEDNFNIEEIEDEPDDPHWMHSGYDDILCETGNGCHFENIAIQIHDTELQDDDEILEIEYIENSFHEVLDSSSIQPSIIMKFCNKKLIEFEGREDSTIDVPLPVAGSFDMNGSRGITLGQSIYEIPGNSDEDDGKPNPKNDNSPHSYNTGESSQQSNLEETDLNAVAIKAVHGLELCSIMLGCKSDSEAPYKSPLSNFRSCINSDGESHPVSSSMSPTPNNMIPFECSSQQHASPNTLRDSIINSSLTGINIVKFDARTDRSQSKLALSKISRELDLDSSFDCLQSTATGNPNLFDLLEPDE